MLRNGLPFATILFIGLVAPTSQQIELIYAKSHCLTSKFIDKGYHCLKMDTFSRVLLTSTHHPTLCAMFFKGRLVDLPFRNLLRH